MSPARAEGAPQEGGDGVSFPLSSSLFLVHCLVAVMFLFICFFFLLLILAPREVNEDILRIQETGDDKELGVHESSKDGDQEGEGKEEEESRDDGAIGKRKVEGDGRTLRRGRGRCNKVLGDRRWGK